METYEVRGRGRIANIIFWVILVASIVAAGYFYYQYSLIKADPQRIVNKEAEETIEAVSKLIELPEENPTVATVLDPELLKSQLFFAKAEKGDKVLIFTGAKKAILYSPSKNKIIEVGPVILGNE